MMGLKTARRAAGLTQAEMAEALGISVRRLGSYERGERDVPPYMLFAAAWIEANGTSLEKGDKR